MSQFKNKLKIEQLKARKEEIKKQKREEFKEFKKTTAGKVYVVKNFLMKLFKFTTGHVGNLIFALPFAILVSFYTIFCGGISQEGFNWLFLHKKKDGAEYVTGAIPLYLTFNFYAMTCMIFTFTKKVIMFKIKGGK